MRYLLISLLLFAGAAQAQDLPALHAVTDVASNDVLNIRAAPRGSAPIIGAFGPHETGIEVVALSDNGRWAQVNWEDVSGWSALRFLERLPGQSNPPTTYACFGTEPFWSLEVDGGNLNRSAIGEDPVPLSQIWQGSGMRPDRFSLLAAGGGRSLAASIRREACSDGMSDRAYGLDIDLILDGDGPTSMFSGCCSLAN